MSYRRSSAFIGGFIALCAQAEVTVKDAWVRATVPAQKTTAAYMTFVSTDNARIVEVRTPVAGHAHIHRTDVKDGRASMEMVDELPLVANQQAKLAPGAFHIMLMDVAKPLKAGDKVPFTFVVEGRKGERSTLEAVAEVRPLGR